MRVELYAGNLHHGGAVAVAATFFDQLPLLWGTKATEWIDFLTVVASPRVVGDMWNVNTLQELDRVEFIVSDDRPKLWVVPNRFYSTDVRFTIFGPSHRGRRARVEVMGFADGSLLPAHTQFHQSDNSERSILARSAGWLKRQRKLALVQQGDVYVVQTVQMAAALKRLVPDRRIEVVQNIVPAVFHDRSKWGSCSLPARLPGEVRLFYPARGYPHKNHSFIPSVCKAFEETYGVPLRVVVTLRPDELRDLGLLGNHQIINVGEVSVSECPALYQATDGLFFPSLNETASSSPMEALFMGKPVVAVDLPFMKTMTVGHAYFYANTDCGSAARAIHDAVVGLKPLSHQDVQGIEWARRLSSPTRQAHKYMFLLQEAAAVRTK